MGICDGRVVIVTGAGRGLGRAHAIELGRQGARVLVNDLGVANDGSGGGAGPAEEVAAEIRGAGGDSLASQDDISDWEASGKMVAAAIARWGRLDAVVNNAGFVRDRMFVSASVDEWDVIMRVHLRGHFCAARHAAAHWRDRKKAGDDVDARIINTTSGAGLLGSIGQSAYSTAKAGIVGLTLVQAAELQRYGVTANAIAPAARTRMTEAVFAGMMKAPETGFDAMAPENVAPFIAWLCSTDSRGVTGRVFEISGGKISVADGVHTTAEIDVGRRWDCSEIGPTVRGLLEKAAVPGKVYGT